MQYALKDLLRVRSFRVDAALRKVVESRQQLLRCQQQRTQLQTELEDYIDFRLQKEKSLYAEVLGQTIKLQVLEDLKANVHLLRFEQSSYEQRVLDAQRAETVAIEALCEAQRKHRQALRAEEKLKHHHELWKIEAKRWLTLKEDAENEDLPFRRPAVT